MSHEGKMKRGKAFHAKRDIDGNYNSWMLGNESIMSDLNYFLENSKPKEPPKETKKEKK